MIKLNLSIFDIYCQDLTRGRGEIMGTIPFIAVEGPIGVGKTSLSKKINNHFQFHLLKEIVEENPFLGKFYDDIEEWSFQTEMFFLCNRYKQLEDINTQYIQQGKPVVADYHIAKNMIFAKRTLKNNQFKKYSQIYQILTSDMPMPNIVVYLNASLDTLLKRIQIRGREIEQNIQATYLQQLSDDYDLFMNQFEMDHPEIPVIRLNGDQIDFVQKEEDLELVLSKIEKSLQETRVYL
jgi:deoxyguanosine kinase